MTKSIFKTLADFYRCQFGEDAEKAAEHSSQPFLNSENFIDAVCVADSLMVEQEMINFGHSDGSQCHSRGFTTYVRDPNLGDLSVGRFCMLLLQAVAEWNSGQATKSIRHIQQRMANPAVCSLGQPELPVAWAHAGGQDIPLDHLWIPPQPLWRVAVKKSQKGK